MESILSKIEELKSIHFANVDRIATLKREEVPTVTEVVTETLNEKQLAILKHFEKWEYGCQHSEVMELVSLLSDIPLDRFKEVRHQKYESRRGSDDHYLTKMLSGIVIKLNKKLGSSVPVAVNEPFMIINRDLVVTSRLQNVAISMYHFGNNETKGKMLETFEIATPEEVEKFFSLLAANSEFQGEYFHRLFANVTAGA